MDLGYKLAPAIPSAMLRIRTASNSPEGPQYTLRLWNGWSLGL